MWWQVVFWIMLVPLVVIEFILYYKTRKFSWLVYTLAIFAYVIAVSYTIDAFDLGKNGVLLILVASAALMVFIARNFKQAPSDTKLKRTLALALTAVLLLLMIVSIFFGKAAETLTPVARVSSAEVMSFYDAKGNLVAPLPVPPPDRGYKGPGAGVTLLTRRITNNYFLPVPVVTREYKACLATTAGVQEMYLASSGLYEQYPEVAVGGQKTMEYAFSQVSVPVGTTATEILVYAAQQQYSGSCNDFQGKSPLYRIPVV